MPTIRDFLEDDIPSFASALLKGWRIGRRKKEWLDRHYVSRGAEHEVAQATFSATHISKTQSMVVVDEKYFVVYRYDVGYHDPTRTCLEVLMILAKEGGGDFSSLMAAIDQLAQEGNVDYITQGTFFSANDEQLARKLEEYGFIKTEIKLIKFIGE